MDEHYDDPEYLEIMRDSEDVAKKIIEYIVKKRHLDQEIENLEAMAWQLQFRLDKWKEQNNEQN